MPFPRFLALAAALSFGAGAPGVLLAQQPEDQAAPAAGVVVDSVLVEGNVRLTAPQIVSAAGLPVGRAVSYRDIQRAVDALFRTGQFDDVVVEQRDIAGGVALVLRVVERPILRSWTVEGNQKVSSGDVREVVKLSEGRPLDRAMAQRAAARIDSVYKRQGYYTADVAVRVLPDTTGGVQLVYDVTEGPRVVVSQVAVEGNTAFPADQIVAQMATRPEGFWWFRKGEYDERKLETDLRERLPDWYANHGYVDFQVTGDSLIPDTTAGKATLRLTVDEGPVYRVGSFEVRGNQRYSTDELLAFYPFGRNADGTAATGQPFDRGAWQSALERLQNLYYNNGYISAQIVPVEERRTGPDGKPVLDLKWNIREGGVATINRINIVGNDVTHERVIRDAIVLLPGEVFSRDKLIRSYQNVSNLGFFQQPLAPPSVDPAENGQDVDITFRVAEKRTGNINFGASLGQGTGIGGFIGLEEPNLFGRGKRGKFQWQFGSRVNDFQLSYTDPSIRESRLSGTVSVYDSRFRYQIEDLGRIRRTGGSVQVGFPLFGSRYTRLYTSYGIQLNRQDQGSPDISTTYQCPKCTRSTLGVSLLRDTRVGLPFAVAGLSTNVTAELNGGVLGGSGNYRKVDLEGRWYAPLGTLGGNGQFGGGVQFVLGLSAKSGFIFGDAGPFFTELYTLGGVQFGVPLRGYDECSITPDGFNASANGASCTAASFGKAFAVFTTEVGARVSQSLYLSAFLDAGNVYRSASQFDPTRLYRGAGLGAALISPLGPIGVDLGYGFDKVDITGKPKPGWQVHFKVGNFY